MSQDIAGSTVPGRRVMIKVEDHYDFRNCICRTGNEAHSLIVSFTRLIPVLLKLTTANANGFNSAPVAPTPLAVDPGSFPLGYAAKRRKA